MRLAIFVLLAALLVQVEAEAQPWRPSPVASAPGWDVGPVPEGRDRIGPYGMARAFKRWEAVCDAWGPCRVRPVDMPSPELHRASPRDPWVLEFQEHRPGARVPVSMVVDGQATPSFTAPVARWEGGDGTGVIQAPAGVAPKLIERLRQGRRITTLSVGQDGGLEDVSLDGLVAAMTWVEDRQPRQARLGWPAEEMTRSLAAVLEEELDPECAIMPENGDWSSFERRRLPSGEDLVRLPCAVDGPAISARFFQLDSKGVPRPMPFVVPAGDRWVSSLLLKGGSFGDDPREIGYHWQSSEVGHCGGLGRWRWNGRRYAMVETWSARCPNRADREWMLLWSGESGRPEPTADQVVARVR